MAELIIPTIGATGFYNLAAPFSTLIESTEMYTCQAIRRIGDYLAYNEDPLNTVYLFYGLTEEDFNADQASNMYIVSLQSEKGQWLYVPAKYLLSYPIMNGVQYRNMMLGVALGTIPVDMDLSAIQALIGDVVYENLGIQPKMSPVALSKPILVSRENHDTYQNARLVRASQKLSNFGRYQSTLRQLNQTLEKVRILEEYIKTKYPPA